MRVIVTGCRNWPYGLRVWQELDELWGAWLVEPDGKKFIVVHGGANGADACAAHWVLEKQGVLVEVWAANWDRLGASAGPRRNAAMVDAGADIALAFWDGRSTGTEDCIRRLTRAAIPLRIIPWGSCS